MNRKFRKLITANDTSYQLYIEEKKMLKNKQGLNIPNYAKKLYSIIVLDVRKDERVFEFDNVSIKQVSELGNIFEQAYQFISNDDE